MSVAQPPISSPEIPILGPGHTYETVTEQITAPVLTRPTTLGWFAGFTVAFSILGMLTVAVGLADHQRRRNLGHQHSHRLGICHRQFRVVDRYRPRRHADFRHSLFAQSTVAHFHQPFRGSHDALRGSLRRFVSADSHWSPVDGLLHVPVSQHHGHLAAIPQPADLGRVRGFHLRHGFAAVLVRRTDSRFGDLS